MIEAGLCRGVINQRIGYLKRIFKWAASEELVSADVYHALQSVDGLRRGRSAARETEPVRPVPDAHVDAVLPFLAPTLQAMVQLQRLTGMRSGELRIFRTCDVDVSGEIWAYRPGQHKTANRGYERVVQIGPRAQQVLKPFLRADLQAFVFSPGPSVISSGGPRAGLPFSRHRSAGKRTVPSGCRASGTTRARTTVRSVTRCRVRKRQESLPRTLGGIRTS